MSTPVRETAVDLTNCDREPIHIPGAIQPQGWLCSLHEPDLRITQLSANTQAFFGLPAEAVLQQPLATLLEPAALAAVQRALLDDRLNRNPLHVFTSYLPVAGQVDAVLHRNEGVAILELEPGSATGYSERDIYHQIKTAVATLQAAPTFSAFCQQVADEVRLLTNYDRVMVYQFDDKGHGTVLAEARDMDIDSYLGLHYPASDIPVQARILYLQNRIRVIADAAYQPAVLLPNINPQTGQALDLSYAWLRSVSPMHRQYLANMGVSASMSISLVKDGALWGLIACHHRSARPVPYVIRTACEFLGQVVSLQLIAKENAEQHHYASQLHNVTNQVITAMSNSDDHRQGLLGQTQYLRESLDSGGLTICLQDLCLLVGSAPARDEVEQLARWLAQQHYSDIFATNMLPAHYPPLAHRANVASGVLAVPIDGTRREYIIWFRPEQVQLVNWAGDPNKPVTISADGEQLTPRASFALWQETVRGQALPWTPAELNAAAVLRHAIVTIILRQSEALIQLNTELAQSNAELDAFAYAASHDLKEPLRGIHAYAHFLLEDEADELSEEGRTKLQTLIRLTQRMEDLLDSLLHYARIGHNQPTLQEADLNQVLQHALDMLDITIERAGLQLRVPRPLPTLLCDPIQLAEVFHNLINNAIKYNTSAEKWVEIGWREEAAQQHIFYVRDNGIGIAPKHHESIFHIFKRLHGRQQFGGGTGVGLTIIKKIIERQGGRVWVESALGTGTTFYFTLSQPL